MKVKERRLPEPDLDVLRWTRKETEAYRKAVGVNPLFAIGTIEEARREAAEDIERRFGDDGAPDGFLPLPLLAVPTDYFLGFVWMAARREDKALQFAAYGDGVEVGDLLGAFFSDGDDDEDDPLAETTEPKTEAAPASRSKTRSTSAAPTAGD